MSFHRLRRAVADWMEPKCHECGQPLTWIGGPWYCLLCPEEAA